MIKASSKRFGGGLRWLCKEKEDQSNGGKKGSK